MSILQAFDSIDRVCPASLLLSRLIDKKVAIALEQPIDQEAIKSLMYRYIDDLYAKFTRLRDQRRTNCQGKSRERPKSSDSVGIFYAREAFAVDEIFSEQTEKHQDDDEEETVCEYEDSCDSDTDDDTEIGIQRPEYIPALNRNDPYWEPADRFKIDVIEKLIHAPGLEFQSESYRDHSHLKKLISMLQLELSGPGAEQAVSGKVTWTT